MIERISMHLMDILAADISLYAGGNAYQAGWAGVKRIDAGDIRTNGWVNLFDSPYEDAPSTERPAIYAGTQALEGADREAFPTTGAGFYTEYRQYTLPLVIVAQGATRHAARQARNQLLANVQRILLQHIIETGYWYCLSLPGDAGGGLARKLLRSSGTGGGAANISESLCICPAVIEYPFNINSLS